MANKNLVILFVLTESKRIYQQQADLLDWEQSTLGSLRLGNQSRTVIRCSSSVRFMMYRIFTALSEKFPV